MYSKTWCLKVLEKAENAVARDSKFWDEVYNSLRREGLSAESADIEREILRDLQFSGPYRLFNAWKRLIKSGNHVPDPRRAQEFVHKFKEQVHERHFASLERELF